MLTVAAVIGLMQSGRDARPAPEAQRTSMGDVQRRLERAPAALRRLHRPSTRVFPASSYEQAREIADGFPVVVNVWASFCEPCRREFGVFRAAVSRFGDRVAFIGLTADTSEKSADAFLADHATPYPNFQDSSRTIADRLDAGQALPSTAFLDSRGRLINLRVGPYEDLEDLERDIRRYALAAVVPEG